MIRILLMVALLGFASAASAHHSIHNDGGGNVAAYAFKIKTHDGPVRISGYCNSACTMWLDYDDVCFAPGARLGFHYASFGDFGKSYYYTWRMSQHYPTRVRAWFRDGPDERRALTRLPIETIVGWGEAELCR